jgi:AbrB family looped-hinge helix DNA binding protein
MRSATLGFLTIDPKGRATFPQELRRELGLGEHTQLRIDRTADGSYELVPVELIPRDQLWYHSAEGRARIERAEGDFESGRSTRTSGEAATQRHLDSLKAGSRERANKGGSPVKR